MTANPHDHWLPGGTCTVTVSPRRDRGLHGRDVVQLIMPTGERLAAPEGAMRLTALAAGAVGAALVATYLAIIVSEGDNTVGEIAPWAALMSGGAVLSLVAAAMPATTARWLLALSALLFLPFVLVSSLSYFFLVPTALTCVAARQAHGLVVSGQPRATAPSP